jgi:hypothetical protein
MGLRQKAPGLAQCFLVNTVHILSSGVRHRHQKRGWGAEIFPSHFTEGRKGHEETGVSVHQISKQAQFWPLIIEPPIALRDLGVKTISKTTAGPSGA